MGFDHIIVITSFTKSNESIGNSNSNDEESIILFRHYSIEYQISNNPKVPYIYLRELGPSMDLTLRRYEVGNASQTKDKSARASRYNTIAGSFDTTGSGYNRNSSNGNCKNRGNASSSGLNTNSMNNNNVGLMKQALVGAMDAKKTLLNKKPKQKNVYLSKIFGERKGKIYINRHDQDLSKLKTKKVKALRKMFNDSKKEEITAKQKRNQKKSQQIKRKFGKQTAKMNSKMRNKGRGKRKFR